MRSLLRVRRRGDDASRCAILYAILGALKRDEKAKDDVVDLYTVGGYISGRVPEISASLQYVPAAESPLKRQFSAGPSPAAFENGDPRLRGSERPEPYYWRRPIIEVRKSPDGDALVTAEATRNALVTVKACDGPWALMRAGILRRATARMCAGIRSGCLLA